MGAAPDPERVITERFWHHHRFSLWELLITHRLLKPWNGVNGLHIAGDYTRGYGQNDALASGILAACAIGVTEAAVKQLYELGLSSGWAKKCMHLIRVSPNEMYHDSEAYSEATASR